MTEVRFRSPYALVDHWLTEYPEMTDEQIASECLQHQEFELSEKEWLRLIASGRQPKKPDPVEI